MEESIVAIFLMCLALFLLKSCGSNDVDNPKEREQILAIEINQAIVSCAKNGGVSMMYVEHTPINLERFYERHSYARCGDGAIFRWKLVNPSTTTPDDERIVTQ